MIIYILFSKLWEIFCRGSFGRGSFGRGSFGHFINNLFFQIFDWGSFVPGSFGPGSFGPGSFVPGSFGHFSKFSCFWLRLLWPRLLWHRLLQLPVSSFLIIFCSKNKIQTKVGRKSKKSVVDFICWLFCLVRQLVAFVFQNWKLGNEKQILKL